MDDEQAPDREDRHTLAGVVTRLRDGGPPDDPAFGDRVNRAFAKHVRMIRHVVRKELLGYPPEQIEDVVQEVFTIAWSKLCEADPGPKFKYWLIGIANGVSVNVRRKRRDLLTADGILDPESQEATLVTRMVQEERDAFVRAVAREVLSAEDQEIAELRYMMSYSHKQIAEILGLADVKEVRVAIQRIGRQMKRALEERVRSSFLE